jgi:Patatin-like phospholipase
MRFQNNKNYLLLCVSILIVSGCATLPRNAIPINDLYEAEIPGMPGIRAFADKFSESFQNDMIQSFEQESIEDFPEDENGLSVYSVLLLSGGGSNGAFGAGILNGWTKTGNRPNFKLVTGISTGALIAPFAFLGEDYDEQLKNTYTTVSTIDILERLNIFRILFQSEALTSTDSFRELISSYINEEVLEAIAEKHDRGYRLYIGTTNMDAQQLVIWNMGMIAKSHSPNALQIFQDILLASAAIPTLFPPVLFEVDVNGKRYDEMHADGGTSVQVFYYRNVFNIEGLRQEVLGRNRKVTSRIYIIRNGQIEGTPQQIERGIKSISERAISTMTKASALGDLYRVYAVTQRDNIDFNYIAIPDEVQLKSTEPFDTVEMNRLYDIGYGIGSNNIQWNKTPPGLQK